MEEGRSYGPRLEFLGGDAGNAVEDGVDRMEN